MADNITDFPAQGDNETFYYDDFFVPEDDPGEKVYIEMDGRQVPFWIKRKLSMGDREAAKRASVKKRFKSNGQVEISDIDEGEFALELVVRCVKKWPFKYRDGRPVPINRNTVREMVGDAADALSLLILDRLKKKDDAKKAF
ncbi:hypothetical protein EI42_03158 [Thermosporothrix hazakensis]|jgi:hypothetical protein|uniref:Tail assembly chaperone n=1 Tax=Thermosporothrix hazakensis TaxID=644383 RepID=A0A326U624_THEHA|nr:hypothetical protein [Thermosporothrix hazakensis]PZW28404.1 hypothetical protein EI42_03158 [Thermosporothrix hazakensis]GCE45184.1 hypothetical protein KTH_00530 [Thermosporothrix hazakensis]